ncbi:MAG: GNAT family N-acetyltransferase [Eubacteriales bacterium]|nr:GNAT family N-acetyltransferase [Eubacteriales bacterium]
MNGEFVIRTATQADAPALLAIYAPYVENTAITFEYEVPSEQEFAQRIRRVLTRYPYLVAEADGELLGYAYAGAFKERAAYQWAVETSVYVRQDQKRRGIGAALYRALEECLAAQGVLNVNACIAYPAQQDEHLTADSVRFHEALGYEMVGRFHRCGYKFGRWYDMVWMEKMIGGHDARPAPVVPFAQIKK